MGIFINEYFISVMVSKDFICCLVKFGNKFRVYVIFIYFVMNIISIKIFVLIYF